MGPGLRRDDDWRNWRADGQITSPACFAVVKPCSKKYSALPNIRIILYASHPAPPKGRCATSTTRGGMRWTLAARKTGARTGGRPSRVVLAPRRWCQVCARARRRRWPTSPEHRGDHGAAVNTIACGNAGFSGGLVVTNSCGTNFFPREAAGALGARHSPRPLFGRGGKLRANLARGSRRECGSVSQPSLRKRSDPASHETPAKPERWILGRCARNDGFAVRAHILSSFRRRPEPITTGLRGCVKAVQHRHSPQRLRRMGPGLRRGDIVSLPYARSTPAIWINPSQCVRLSPNRLKDRQITGRTT